MTEMSGYHHGSYDDGCPDCGTTDTVHTDGCRRAPVEPAARRRNRGHIHTGAVLSRLPVLKNVGDECNVCEGPCRYGNCPRCGGHSEHNWGCPETPTAADGR